MPLIPNADTPARRGWPFAAHGTGSVSSRTAPAVQSTCGVGSSACSVRGSRPCRRASTILITPATPAAAWVWPRFDLTEPSHSGRSRSCPYVASSAWASIGSPSAVPVPCASTASTSAAFTPALASAARMTRCWDGPFGAVSPLLAPSWLTALPRITASTGCPFLSASDSRSSSTIPAPSARPMPSATRAERLAPAVAGQRSLPGEPREGSGRGHHGDAAGQRQVALAGPQGLPARCSATSEDEHAVSTVTAGPSRPRV